MRGDNPNQLHDEHAARELESGGEPASLELVRGDNVRDGCGEDNEADPPRGTC